MLLRATSILLFIKWTAMFHAQACPKDNYFNGPSIPSQTRTLEGKLLFHDDLRQWFELKLDHPVCGQTSMQLVRTNDWHLFERYRGCHLQSTGVLGIPGTGYYSTAIYQDVTQLIPSTNCVLQRRFPDYSRLKPAAPLRNYDVQMKLHYQIDGPLEVTVTHGRTRLEPWQEYASYFLTGGFAYYAYCAEGCVAEHERGTQQGKPWNIDGYIAFDPESVPRGVDPILLSYDCRRGKFDN